MNGDGKRFQESSFLEGHVIGHLEAEVGRMLDILSEGAIDRRCSKEANIRAKVVTSRHAMLTGAARDSRFHGNTITYLQCGNTRAYTSHNARRLVAQYNRPIADEWSTSAMCPVVYI